MQIDTLYEGMNENRIKKLRGVFIGEHILKSYLKIYRKVNSKDE